MNDIYVSLIDMRLVTGYHLSYLGYLVKNILKTISNRLTSSMAEVTPTDRPKSIRNRL